MKLVPANPPRRRYRKARSFEAEIVQLRVDGYTLEEIRESLASVGVQVSLSTVSREARRTEKAAMFKAALDERPAAVSPPVISPQPPSGSVVARPDPSPKEVAEAFVDRQITNPLFRAKDRS